MKSRLTSYLQGMKLARVWLQQAREFDHKDEGRRALHCLIQSHEEMLIAMNNFASIAFNAKPKK